MRDVLSRNQILQGDALDRLRSLPDDHVDCVVTSPPYFRLRDYDQQGQIGLESHVDDWADAVCAIATESARVLVPTGSLWLNLGDSYSTHPRQGASRKSLLLGPERVVSRLVADGWILRNKIVWAKTNPIPSSVRDRVSCTYEVIYLLTRRSSYYFDLDGLRVPHTSRATPRQSTDNLRRQAAMGPNADGDRGLAALHAAGISGHPLGKNPGDVWRLGTSRYRGAHFATFPEALARRMITAGCPDARCRTCRLPWRRPVQRLGRLATRLALAPTCDCKAPSEAGLVLDPFMGAGTTAVAAEALGRDWLGIELNPAYIDLAQQRLKQARDNTNQHRKEVA